MTTRIDTKVLVLGGGPGGYVAAIRAGQLGLDTVLVDRDGLGGTCLNRGCIPSKALIEAATRFASVSELVRGTISGVRLACAPELDLAATMQWKDGIVERLRGGVASLLHRSRVRVVAGWGRFSDAKTCHVTTADGEVAIVAEHVVLATGSVPAELPMLPFGGPVVSSTEALALRELPRRLVVVGAGTIGLELGIAFRKLGAEVAIVEQQPRLLPLCDDKLSEPVRLWLERHGVTLHLCAAALGWEGNNPALRIRDAAGTELLLPADKVLVTVGRRPALGGWGFEEMAVALEGRFVAVDERCATSMKNVWAIGDLVGEPMLAHKASAQGEMVAHLIAGEKRRFDPVAIPAVCFSEPEIVSVGASLEEAQAQGATVSVFPFKANGRALTMNADGQGGFVRVLSGRDHRILGIQAVGAHVSELAAAFALAVEMGALLEDIEGTIFAHPTLGEAFREAAQKGLGMAIHA